MNRLLLSLSLQRLLNSVSAVLDSSTATKGLFIDVAVLGLHMVTHKLQLLFAAFSKCGHAHGAVGMASLDSWHAKP